MSQSEWASKKVEQFVILNQKLGEGTYGTVYRGYFSGDETRTVAVKAIPMKLIKDSQKLQELIKREVHILQRISHPNIVKLHHISKTQQSFYMFLEYCNDGDLREYLNRKQDKRLSEIEAVLFFKHIISGFKTLYQHKVIHRDIKPANILLHNGVAKITDFGFARVLEQGVENPAYLSRLGSPLYMAPQILGGQPFSGKCDIWSVGIMFYEFLYGTFPWMGESQYELYNNIMSKPLVFPKTPVRSQTIKQLIASMLAVEENNRISWEALFQHEVVTIDEQKIKKNVSQLMKEHDTIVRSASLNKIYLDNHLVVGYIKEVDLKEELNITQVQESKFLDDAQMEIIKDANQDPQSQFLISQYQQEQTIRKSVLRINQYFQFERNLAFFLNFVIQRVISIMVLKVLSVSNTSFFKLMFCISKNQMVHSTQLQKQLMASEHPKFEKELWVTYKNSLEYKQTADHIKLDLQHSLGFFTEVLRKTLQNVQVTNQLASKKTMEEIQEFMSIVDNNFAYNDKFQKHYATSLKDFLVDIEPYIQHIRKKCKDKKEFGYCAITLPLETTKTKHPKSQLSS